MLKEYFGRDLAVVVSKMVFFVTGAGGNKLGWL